MSKDKMGCIFITLAIVLVALPSVIALSIEVNPCIFVVCGPGQICSYGQCITEEPLVAEYKFDESSGSTATDSAGDNDGTIYTATRVPGMSGNALDFDGTTSSVRIPDFINTTSHPLSWMAWYKIEGPYYMYRGFIMDQWNYNADRAWALTHASTNGVQCWIWTQDDEYKYVAASNNANDGNWHFTACVYDGTTLKAYHDGVYVGSVQSSMKDSTRDITIGARHAGAISFFNGKIDEVKLFYSALSESEVQNIYNELNPCTPNSYSDCHNGDVYWFDACDNLGSKKQECGTDIIGTSYCSASENLIRDDTIKYCNAAGECDSYPQTVSVETCDTYSISCTEGDNCACSNGDYYCDVAGTKSCKDCIGDQCQQCTVSCDRSQQSSGDNDGDGIDNECDTENILEDCNDGIDNNGDGSCDDYGCSGLPQDTGCVNKCTQCLECGNEAFDFCEELECEQDCGLCYYDSGWVFGIGSFCCTDSDSDTICDADDVCSGYNDNADSDSDGTPNGCDQYPYDFDNDNSPDNKDCWDDDDSQKEMDICDHKTCQDGCYNGIYFDYTDCDKICVNDICEDCVCASQHLYIDSDGDGYDNGCDQYTDDTCSVNSLGDNCSSSSCIPGSLDFCSNECSDPDSDTDGISDSCDLFPNDQCSIYVSEDNCGEQSCQEGSTAYCSNCNESDVDFDGINDLCDTENILEDCNDGVDNDGNGFCDDNGCNCNAGNNFCETGNSSLGFIAADPSCANMCTQCPDCGAGLFEFCEEIECNGCGSQCTFKPGIRLLFNIGNDCCNDTDQDGFCNEEDVCEGFDDNVDQDADGMPDACDTCATEPAITTETLELSEVSCDDGIDNDCDQITDIDDYDCQCGEGTARCDDGSCEAWCGAFYPCNNDGICDKVESCDCADCAIQQASCISGLACNPSAQICTSEPDLSPELCEYSIPATMQGTCDIGESNCWAASIPSDVTIIGDVRCCGDDPMETWSYETDTLLEDLIVEFTCYEGEWVRVSESGVTLFDIGLE